MLLSSLIRWVPRLPSPGSTAAGVILLAIFGGTSDAAAQRGDRPGHVMTENWRQFDVDEAPVLSPEDGLASLRVAPGFRAELVAAEPLVVDPVAIAWDPWGRLFVAEMRGFMPNVDGEGEQQPVGQIVVLEDTDGDTYFDRSSVFLDGLVNPRAIAVVDQGLLIGEPNNLWLCRYGEDLRCAERTRLLDYGDADPDLLEHTENGLLQAVDNWIYNAKSDRRFRYRAGQIEVERTRFRGQWGIAQDSQGRLFYNTNSRYLYGDLIAAEYVLRSPNYRPDRKSSGLGQRLVEEESVYSIRVNPGVNRGYMKGILREDGRLAVTTSVSGLVVYRGDQFHPDFEGDFFIPEPAGNVVAHFDAQSAGHGLDVTHVTYPDPVWGERDFLASTDERFRPVNISVGPDGALYVVDMYRGILQHVRYVTSYLRQQILHRKLDQPIGLGRIYRIVQEDGAELRSEVRIESRADAIAALEHDNGWHRDTAQRLLVERGGEEPAEDISKVARSARRPESRLQALWTLHGLDQVDSEIVTAALSDPSPWVRSTAARVSEALDGDGGVMSQLARLARKDEDPTVRLQALHSLGELGQDDDSALETLLQITKDQLDDPLVRQALLTGFRGRELDLATQLRGRAPALEQTRHEALTVAFRDPMQRADVLDHIAQQDEAARTLLWPKIERVAGENDLVAAASEEWPAHADARIPEALRGPLQATFAATPKSEISAELLARGQQLYSACRSCHGRQGTGEQGLGPTLVDTEWIKGSVENLVRIVLHGLEGPLEIEGESWDDIMPGFVQDPRFSDEGVAALLTFVRNSWGNAAGAVEESTVQEIRRQSAERRRSWSVDELLQRSRPGTAGGH